LTMLNALTVDVEDYFQVSAFERYVDRSKWDTYPLRVVENTSRVLDLFDEFSVKGTFFVLGWVADRCPALVRDICDRGHEIACHGYGHELVYKIGPERFRADIREAKAILEDQCGVQVNGYRAPSYSITSKSLWALEILVEEGFTYDSSIFPVMHDLYGIPDAERFPHVIRTVAGPLVEFPLTTLPIRLAWKKLRLPIAGGGYLRLLPVELLRYGVRRINEGEQQPTVLYFHPWEIDPDQPRIKAGLKSSFRHYQNLAGTENKLKKIISSFEFTTMYRTLNSFFVSLPSEMP